MFTAVQIDWLLCEAHRNLFLARRLKQPMKRFSMITCLILPAKQISGHEFARTSAIRIRLLDGTELKDWDSFSQEPISDYNPCLSPLASFNSRNQSLLVWNIYRRVKVCKVVTSVSVSWLIFSFVLLSNDNFRIRSRRALRDRLILLEHQYKATL